MTSDFTGELAQVEAELAELRASWEFAFAYGHGCSIGEDPQFWITRARYDKLMERHKQLDSR